MKTWLKRAAAAVLSLSLLAAPVLAAAETAGSSTLNLSDNTVYTYSTQSVTSDSGKQTNLHENIFTYRKEAQVRPVVAFGSTLYGTSAMNKTVKTLEEQGYSMSPGSTARSLTVRPAFPTASSSRTASCAPAARPMRSASWPTARPSSAIRRSRSRSTTAATRRCWSTTTRP